LEEFNEITSRTKLCFDFDVVGKRHRFFWHHSTAVSGDWKDHPIRVCASMTPPEGQFVELWITEWRKVLYEGAIEARVELIGIQSEIMGIFNYSLNLCGLEHSLWSWTQTGSMRQRW
jgi:hypothetical protein